MAAARDRDTPHAHVRSAGWNRCAAACSRPARILAAGALILAAAAAGVARAQTTVSAGSPALAISTSRPTVAVPVTITRTDNTSMLGFSVTFTLGGTLTKSSVAIGPFLSASGGNPILNVVDHGGGQYTADGATLGTPCGSDALSGTLFNIAVASGAASGTGTVTINSVILRDCSNATLPSSIGAGASVTIDNTPPTVTLTAPNGGELWAPGSVRNITWAATDLAGVSSIDLEYSTNSGGSWTAIASGLANSGSYAWTVPNAISATALVRVTAHDTNGNTANDVSNAVFSIQQYPLDVTVIGGGSVTKSPDQSTYANGTLVTLQAVPSSGHFFSGWSGDLSGSTNPVALLMDAPKSVTATFGVSQYTLDVAVVGSGTVTKSPDQPSYTAGTQVTLQANAAAGYHFVSWSGGVTSAVNPVIVTINANTVVTATFAINQYPLDVTIVGAGTVSKSPDQPAYDHGSTVQLQATPAPGYHFVGWSGDAIGSANPISLYMDAAKAVTATFAIDEYPLTVSVVGNGSVTRSPDQASYALGTAVTLAAVPAPGYHFVGWSGDTIETANPITVTIFAAKSLTATFAINHYTLDVTIVGSGTVTRTPSYTTYAHGSSVSLLATPAPGFHFVGWSGDTTESANPITFVLTSNKAVTATFAINQYTLSVTVSGHGSVSKSPDLPTYAHGTSVALLATADPGYHFVGWSGDTTESANPITFVMTANKAVTATFAINQYPLSVTVVGSGSVTKTPDQPAYDHGSVVSLLAVPATGYHFVGWSGDTTSSANLISLTLTAPRSVTATFAPNQYTLTLSVVGNGTASAAPIQATYAYGTRVTLTATPATGSQFVAWSGDTVSSANPVTITIDGNKSVTATFATNHYTLTVTTVGSGSVSRTPNQASYVFGTVVALQAIPAAGYHFVGWSGDLTGSTNPSNLTIDGDKAVTATFAINHYTLNVSAVGSGSVSVAPNQPNYTYGTQVVLQATPAAGYHLVSWSGDLSGSANPDTITMDADKSITATFAINQYALNVSTVGNGSVVRLPNQSLYDHGTAVALTASAGIGYHFAGWSGDLSGSANPDTLSMTAAKSITATFVINQYALNVAIVGSGTVSKAPNQGTYAHGTAVTLAATPAAGYHFVSWSGDASGNLNPIVVTMDAAKSVTATFAANQFALNVSILGDGAVIKVPDLVSYSPGAQVTLTATPATGSLFLGWAGDLSDGANPATLTMDGNKSVTASFAPITNRIVVENQLPGTPQSTWDVTNGGDVTIQGFATQISVNAGETISFKVDTHAPAFHFDIYRIGYYQGNGARYITTIPGTPALQPAPITDTQTGLVDCGNWTVSGSWNVPSNAVSGVYIAKVTREDTQGANHVIFIVRDDAGASRLLFQTSDATWQAYNTYGGYSFYTGPTSYGHGVKISYNRPFTSRITANEDFFFSQEYPMVRWLEANGYDVSYFTDVDADRRGNLIRNHAIYMPVGHDEYWSGTQRANVTAARDAGTNIAFFTGNEVYWKTRFEPSVDGTGTADRTLVCYKEGTLGERVCGGKCDPAPGVWTGLWRDGCPPSYAPNDGCLPENALTGNISWFGGSAALTVPASYRTMRIWRNTSVTSLSSNGVVTLAPWTLGFEWDQEQPQYAASYPASRIGFTSTTLGGATHHASLYRIDGGGLVFGAGTVQWSWGLDKHHDRGFDDPSTDQQQATLNLLAEMGAQSGTPQTGLTAVSASGDRTPPVSVITFPASAATLPAGQPVLVQGTSNDAAGVVAKVQISADGGATWADAQGTSSWTYLWTPSALGIAALRARAADDWANLETPGAGVSVTVTPNLGANCPCTVLSGSSEPVAADGGDGSAIEVGVKLRADADGALTGLRFYKSAANLGTHVGHVWSSSGALLGSVTFASESATGWQQASFTTPVSVTAGVTMIASVFMPQGHYAADGGFFAHSGIDVPPLHALQNGVDGPDGVFVFAPSGGFPTASVNASNYWVDAVYITRPDTTPPTLVNVSPDSGSTGIGNSTHVTATFSEPIDSTSLSTTTFQLLAPGGAPVPAAVSYAANSHLAVLTPSVPLSFSTLYTASLKGGPVLPHITDASGNALATTLTWKFTTSGPPAAPPDEGPGGPVLVISAAANPFSRYYAEILKTEGFNEFTAKDISLVAPAVLAGYDAVVLGEVPLTSPQVTMLSDWVNAGGTLIAMRPDAKLATLLGLTAIGDSLANKYLHVGATGAGQGITGVTMQFHGAADRYLASGATVLATLYSDTATATVNPAVTTRAVGTAGGSATAFTYDLARSVVYTRQGNPAWAGQNRDGLAPIGASDLFFGAAAFDAQPDWVDLSRVAVPQADEQQRLLANLIVLGSLHRKPLPRMWYLPSAKKAAIILTGDDHDDTGLQPHFDVLDAQSTANCSVEDWECVRATGYMYVGFSFTPSQAETYSDRGFEVAQQLNTGCSDWTRADLDTFYTGQAGLFSAVYPNLPAPVTTRSNCSVWSDWSSMAEVDVAHGVRLDTNYRFAPLVWVKDRPGMFTGSGLPMRFAKTDGSLIDCYQAPTQMTDESGQSYPMTVDSLLTRALDGRGYYGAFCADLRFDNPDHSSSDAIVASAKAFGVPVVSARQMLTWLDARDASSFTNLTWDGTHLGFTVVVDPAARNLQGMLPLLDGRGQIVALTQDGTPITYSIDVIKGVTYAFFAAGPGAYVATYLDDTAPPAITNLVAMPAPTGTSATVTWTTNELADSRIDYGPGLLSLSSSSPAPVSSHVVTLTNLVPGTSYLFRVTSIDAFGHPSTSPLVSQPAATFKTPPAPCFADGSRSEFAAGQTTSTYVSLIENGEVMLAPALGAEFDALPPSTQWQSFPWDSNGTSRVANGMLSVNDARFNTEPLSGYGPGHSLEFVATFAATRFQNIGFGGGNDHMDDGEFNVSPWAMFGTGTGETSLLARTWAGGPLLDYAIPLDLLGSAHRYRIDWKTNSIDFYVDGALVNSQPVAIAGPMRPGVSDFSSDGDSLNVDWIHMGPYAASGTFLSRVGDAGRRVDWGSVTWSVDQPAGTNVAIAVRAGDTPVPGASWSNFAAVAASGANAGVTGRYVQYRATLTTADVSLTPSLTDIGISCADAALVDASLRLPNVTLVRPPAPNPALGRTVFEYQIGTDIAGSGQAQVSLDVYDIAGRRVRALEHRSRAPGVYREVWDTSDSQGQRLQPGVYFYRLEAGRAVFRGSVVVLR